MKFTAALRKRTWVAKPRKLLALLHDFTRLGAVQGVVAKAQPPVPSDFGGGDIYTPIVINSTTGDCFIYTNGVIRQINLANVVYVVPGGQSGTVDMAPAINGTITNAPTGAIIFIYPGIYKCSSGITVPVTKTLLGLSHAADAGNAGQLGVELTFDASVLTCVTLDGGANAGRACLSSVTITRNVAAPAGSIGLLVQGSNDAVIEDVFVLKQETGVKCAAGIGVPVGICLNRVITSQISQTHYWITDCKQTRLFQCRAGKNGGLDTNCREYLRVSATIDTLWCIQCNFNQSSGSTTRCIFVDNLSGIGLINGDFNFVQCHFENAVGSTNVVESSGTAQIPRLIMDACTINVSGVFFNGTPSGFCSQFVLTNCPYVLPPMTVTGGVAIRIDNVNFLAAVVIDSGSGSIDASFNQSLTIQGAFTGMFVKAVFTNSAATFTNSGPATGQYAVECVHLDATKNAALQQRLPGTLFLPQGQLQFPAVQNPSANANTMDDWQEGVSWTPVLTALTVGDQNIAYSTQIGKYWKWGPLALIYFNIVTSTFTHTSSSGAMLINGLPGNASAGMALAGKLTWSGITKAGYTEVSLQVADGQSRLTFIASGSAVSVTQLQASDFPSGGTVSLVGWLMMVLPN